MYIYVYIYICIYICIYINMYNQLRLKHLETICLSDQTYQRHPVSLLFMEYWEAWTNNQAISGHPICNQTHGFIGNKSK